MNADERAKAVKFLHRHLAMPGNGFMANRLAARRAVDALDAQLTAAEKERDEWQTRWEKLHAWYEQAVNRAVAAEKENQRLREMLPTHDYHVVEFRENGWGLQHPIECRADLIGCPVNRAIEEGVDETGGPLAPLGRHRVDLNDDGLLFRWIAALSQGTGKEETT